MIFAYNAGSAPHTTQSFQNTLASVGSLARIRYRTMPTASQSRSRPAPAPRVLTSSEVRRLWIHAQRLDVEAPFGAGPEAVRAAVEQLGYVQIDTINVIERCHHHILYNRIPAYRRADLRVAQSLEKTVFEFWTHALSYLPARDFPYFVAEMKRHRDEPDGFAANVGTKELRRILKRVREEGALTISDIKDDELKADKEHPWASRKPSKAALQAAFYNGQVVIAARAGMLKTYELTERHFGWERLPAAATAKQRLDYLLDRALRSQGVVSVDSVAYGDNPIKKGIAELIERRVKTRKLVPVRIGEEIIPHWAEPAALESLEMLEAPALTHILSPFDPLIIQRRRTKLIFGYDHLFEAYLSPAKRKYGYFTLPVLVGEDIVAMLDLKTDRQARQLLIQAWHWTDDPRHRAAIDSALARFEKFQLAD